MKQRLVGTLVLGSLALILIPLLLDGEGVERPPLATDIPPAPVIDTTPLPEPARPDILADRLAPAASDITSTSEAAASEAAASVAPAGQAVADADSVEASAANPAPPAAADGAAATEAEAAPVANANVAEVAPTEPEPLVQSASTPALDVAGLPETWTVRVGVFGNKANAERLTARLAADNFKAFIRPVGVSSGVYIGPVATRDEAAAIQQQVNAAKAKYQVDNVIVQRFDIGQE